MSRSPFPSLRVAGGLLPADLFGRLLDDKTLAGRAPEEYRLAPHETVREAASRAFDYLRGTWQGFCRERDRAIAEGRPLTGLTRERWLLIVLRGLGYGLVSTTPPGGLVIEDKAFKVSHQWEHVPIHLLGWGIDLDRRTKGVAGAADAAPQSMMQELLNRTDDHLWAIVSNGQKLRLLRDSRALAGSAYVELDIELIFDEQLFSDFVLLYRLVHASRFTVEADDPPSSCWLEKWRSTAIAQGERARERLRDGVEQAINTLGTGFLRHPANTELRERLASGRLARGDYNRSILRLVYRMLFWFVAEDREVLLDPDAPVAARDRYARFFSAARLRERARRGGADHHDDLWEAVRLVFIGLGEETGRAVLALPGIGGLFERITFDETDQPFAVSQPDELDEPLEGLRLTNNTLITAVRHLAVVEAGGRRRPVDFRNLDSEELGSVYESLLELHPSYDPAEQTFRLTSAAGNERKTTGSYYTPSSLTDALLDSALDPLLDEAANSAQDDQGKVDALLAITVCDPACGSGHFLVAAARRIARRIAQIRSAEKEPAPDLVQHTMREVVSHCIHGVDINETAAELAKVSLWLESVEPGKPLPFLDANIRVGNSLLGTTPALIERGLPKEAFKPLIGDDKDAAKAIAKRNREQSQGTFDLFAAEGPTIANDNIARHTSDLIRDLPNRLVDVYVQRRRLRGIDDERLRTKRVADAWCAAFVQPKTQETALVAITESTLGWIADEPDTEERWQTADTVRRLTRDYRFFHWHVEFPHIFAVPDDQSEVDKATGWRGGFTCVIGNPPWEHIELKEQEFFASRRPTITEAANAAKRKRMIEALEPSDDEVDRDLYRTFNDSKRFIECTRHFITASERYPLTARGRIKTDPLFAEAGRRILAQRARVGMVLPTGIATDSNTQYFFKDLVGTQTLASLYDFENEEKIFPQVDHRVRFCLWTASGWRVQQKRIHLAFRLRQPIQIHDRRFTLTPEEIMLLNPNTGTCPVFDYRRNAEITLSIYRRVPVLLREQPEANPWRLSFTQGLFNMASDSALFHNRETLEAEGWSLDGNIFARSEERELPLYEAKMVHYYDHRLGTYEGQTQAQANLGTLPRPSLQAKNDPTYSVLPRYWVGEQEVETRLAAKGWDKDWLLGWRDICRSSDVRTVIASSIPRAAVGDKLLLALVPSDGALLQANLTAFVLDFCARQKIVGTSLKYFLFKQLPVLPPASYAKSCPWAAGRQLNDWITERSVELSYSAYDMEAFARDHGEEGSPFRWDEERRFWLRAELDAAYFHLYGVPRDDVDYIMDTFRAFRNNDPERFVRTKNAILDIYDAMAKAIEGGEAYKTVLDPPPGQGPRHPAPSSEVATP